jgi:hypothetical protein
MSMNPGGARVLERLSADSFNDFVDILYQDIDDAIEQLEKNPQLRQGDSEDRLTVEIVSVLAACGYSAEHEAKSGGNVDITVTHSQRKWRWLGEAKHFKSVSSLEQGYKQLITRYTRGGPGQNRAGLIGYLKRKNVFTCMEQWKEKLRRMRIRKLTISDCPLRPGVAFFTKSVHPVSGLPFEVRHLSVSLYFNPQDKSGLSRKAKRAKK